VGIAAPPSAPTEHVDAAVGYLQGLGFAVTVLPDSPGLVVARTVAMLAAFALDAVDAGVATPEDVDTAMRLGVNYPRGPHEWGAALGWDWVAGMLDALAAAEDPQRYRVSAHLRSLAVEPVPEAVDMPAETSPADVDADTVADGTDAALILATRAADAMWVSDAASQALGMIRLDVAPGYARFAMTVRPEMVNGHRICHGGYIFTLADTAFAFACNSYNRNTVAQSCDIVFVKAVYEGDTLVAEAAERYREGRNGIYDVTIYRRPAAPVQPAGLEPGATASGQDEPDAKGEVVAEFRGRSREVPGTLVVESGD
jgi:3-hydroxybutyryl-CoA dehydrogenase